MGGTTFFIAVGGVSLILFWLMVRADRIRDRRRAYADSIASNTSSISSGNDGFGLLNWFSGNTSSSSNDSCASPSSFSGGSDGSCSDGGGGGGDGGGD